MTTCDGTGPSLARQQRRGALVDPEAREQLRSARQLAASQASLDRARMDAFVEFEDEASGERRLIMLVHPSAADDNRGRVSVLEPLGMALLGLREGERVDWPLENGGRRRIRVIRVLAPLASGGSSGDAT